MENNEAIRKAKNFDDILDLQYGKIGTGIRDKFEENAQHFIISELKRSQARSKYDARRAGE